MRGTTIHRVKLPETMMTDRLSDAVAHLRDECFYKHINKIMETKPAKRSEKTQAIGQEMRIVLRNQGIGTRAAEAFAHLIEMMIEAKLDIAEDDR